MSECCSVVVSQHRYGNQSPKITDTAEPKFRVTILLERFIFRERLSPGCCSPPRLPLHCTNRGRWSLQAQKPPSVSSCHTIQRQPLAWCLWGAGTPGPRMGHPLSKGAGPWGWGEDSWWSRAGEAAGHGTVCRGLEAAASSRAGPCRSRGGRGGWRVQHGSLQPRPCPLSTARGAQAA